jgi:hypothetical protein
MINRANSLQKTKMTEQKLSLPQSDLDSKLK